MDSNKAFISATTSNYQNNLKQAYFTLCCLENSPKPVTLKITDSNTLGVMRYLRRYRHKNEYEETYPEHVASESTSNHYLLSI